MKMGTTDRSDEELISQGPVFFSIGFRPFFLGAALFAGFAGPAWMLMLAGGVSSTLCPASEYWRVRAHRREDSGSSDPAEQTCVAS